MANFSDNFNRADNTTTLGAPWSALNGIWGISSNKAKLYTAQGDSQSTVAVDVAVTDGTVSVALIGGGDGGLIFRATDANNYYLLAVRSGGSFEVYKRVSGSFTSLGSHAATFVSGDVWAVEMSGSTYTIKRNGTTQITKNDSTFLTQTKVGMRHWSGFEFDDFAFVDSAGGASAFNALMIAP